MAHPLFIFNLLLGVLLTTAPTAHARTGAAAETISSGLAQLSETYNTYAEDGLAIDYPSGWRIERPSQQSIRLMNYDPIAPLTEVSAPIKTEIWLIDENPAVVVGRELDTLQQEQAQVNRYRVVTVDQQSGIRIWLGGLTGDFSHAIKTYVGYGDRQTVMIVSHYASPGEADEAAAIEIEAAVLRIHDSFKKLAIADES
ncbi:hypothetical protein [Almyronema epifaneia]|uniref:DUF1795 domain-containing protein n=1 Tax=Almyronema epifaneia S1 TaxID=2991925 RepID=A0ABW6IIP6_9CYAN